MQDEKDPEREMHRGMPEEQQRVVPSPATSDSQRYKIVRYTLPPYGAPPYGAPPYGAPPYGAPPYGAPPYGVPPYGAPPYGTPPYGTPPYGTPPYGTPPYGVLMQEKDGQEGNHSDDGSEVCVFDAPHGHPMGRAYWRGTGVYTAPYTVVSHRSGQPMTSLLTVVIVAFVIFLGVVLWRGGDFAGGVTTGVAGASSQPDLACSLGATPVIANDSMRIMHPPSISFEQYRRILNENLPEPLSSAMAGEMEDIYCLLVHRGIDPAVHAAVSIIDGHMSQDVAIPPYRNLHGVIKGSEFVQYSSYREGVDVWIKTICPLQSCSGQTVREIVKVKCIPPQCNREEAVDLIAQYIAQARKLPATP